jgi:hypothetical protein
MCTFALAAGYKEAMTTTHESTPANVPGIQIANAGGLLAAAFAGLVLGTMPGCTGDNAAAPMEEPGADKFISSKEDKTMTFAKFKAECDTRGGFVQTHATCSGNNACRGMSFNKFDFVVTEHSCRAANTCGGMSCVVLQADTGRAAADMYKKKCQDCHGEAPNFTLFVAPGTDLVAATATFKAKPTAQLASIVAFGVTGVNESGSAYSNMAPTYDQYSRAEIERMIVYIKTLDIKAEEFTILGQGPDPVPPGS